MTATYQIAKSELVSALELCIPVTKAKSPMPVLANARFTLNGSLAFAATDTILSVVGERALEKPGAAISFGVDPSRLLAAASRMSDGPVTLAVTDSKCTLKRDGRTFSAPIVDVAVLPEPTVIPKQGLVYLPSAAVRSVIERTKFAVSPAGEEKASDGVQLLLVKKTLAALSTDGRHAVRAKVSVDSSDTLLFHVPPRLIPHVMAATESSQDVQIGATADSLFIRSPVAGFRFLQGGAPPLEPWLDRVAQSTGLTLALPDSTADTLRYVSVSQDHGKGVVLTRNGTELHVVGTSTAGELAEETIPVEDGAPFRLRLAVDRLLPALLAAGSGVRMTVTDGSGGGMHGVCLHSEGFEYYLGRMQLEA